jgi:hypothetical protein
MPPDDDVAAVVAVLSEVMAKRSVTKADHTPPWRFSGRWFNNGPYTASRRPRIMPN